MKINTYGPNLTRELAGTRRPPKAAAGDAAGRSAGASGEVVSLSDGAKLAHAVRTAIKDIPVVDEARVAELRTEVDTGRYQPELKAVASGIVDEALQYTASAAR